MKTTRNRKTRLITLVLCAALLLGCAPAAGAEEAGISAPGISFYSADEADGHFEQETETNAGEMPESPEEDLNREGEETGDPAEAFVARCYRLVLEREPETEGLRQWAELLKSRQMTAAQVIAGFLNSDEFRGKHKTAEDLVEILYRVMLGREADEGGRQMWLKLITKGGNMSRLINGGSESTELIEEMLFLTEQFERRGGLTCRSRARATLIGLGFPQERHDLRCDQLSGGQRSKLSLGKLLLSEPDLILLDEPTNHLDIDSVEWLENFLRDYKGAALIISHDRYFLDRVTTRTLEIDHRKITAYQGGYSAYLKQKERDRVIAQRHYDNTMEEVRRIEKIIEQQKQWNRERNIRTAESKQKSIDRLLDGLEKPEAEEKTLHFHFETAVETGSDVLICQDLTKGFGGKPLFSGVDLLLKKGDRAFLLGPNGCGKTTLLRVLIGQYAPDRGLRKLGENVRVGYFDQSLEGLHDEKTVLDEVWDAYRRLSQTEVRSALAAFLFRGDEVFAQIGDLSGGEKARVALLKLMLGGYNLLLLDEPTNHLDITSREALEQALLDYNGTMLIVSHDRYFINKIATRILRLNPDGAEPFGNDYDDYLRRMEERKAGEVKQ